MSPLSTRRLFRMLLPKSFVLFLMLGLVSNHASAQIEVSVPFDDGFIGVIGSNPQQANNIQRFSTLSIAKISFVQTTNSGRFELTQGNDVVGALRIQMINGRKFDIGGSLVWRENAGNTNVVLGFLASSSVSVCKLPLF